MRLSEMKLSEKMLARAERMRKRGHRAYAMFLRNDAREVAKLEAENEALEDKERRAWEYARFFSGRSELLRLHIRAHLGLSHKDCIAWGEHDYRDALLTKEDLPTLADLRGIIPKDD